MVAEKYSFSNSNNSKEFLTLLLEMHSANQEDPIMLATTINNLCYSFGRISRVSKLLNLGLFVDYERSLKIWVQTKIVNVMIAKKK